MEVQQMKLEAALIPISCSLPLRPVLLLHRQAWGDWLSIGTWREEWLVALGLLVAHPASLHCQEPAEETDVAQKS